MWYVADQKPAAAAEINKEWNKKKQQQSLVLDTFSDSKISKF